MSNKTQIFATENSQEIIITREFDVPLELLFKGFIDKELVSQWMGTNVKQMQSKNFGNYEFETIHNGEIVFNGLGVFHEIIENKRIVRTFEMKDSGLDVQLEFLDFDKVSESKSKLRKQIIYRSEEHRAKHLKMPFEYGINKAHNKLEEILKNIKS